MATVGRAGPKVNSSPFAEGLVDLLNCTRTDLPLPLASEEIAACLWAKIPEEALSALSPPRRLKGPGPTFNLRKFEKSIPSKHIQYLTGDVTLPSREWHAACASARVPPVTGGL